MLRHFGTSSSLPNVHTSQFWLRYQPNVFASHVTIGLLEGILVVLRLLKHNVVIDDAVLARDLSEMIVIKKYALARLDIPYGNGASSTEKIRNLTTTDINCC